jgi:hypothetical protein
MNTRDIHIMSKLQFLTNLNAGYVAPTPHFSAGSCDVTTACLVQQAEHARTCALPHLHSIAELSCSGG